MLPRLLLGTSSRGVLGILYQKDPGADSRDLLAWESLSGRARESDSGEGGQVCKS